MSAKEKIVATYYFKTEEEKNYYENNLKIGSTLSLNGEKNELTNNTIPNTFNYQKYLYNQKIYFSFYISSIKIKNTNLTFFEKIKNNVNERIIHLGNNAYLRAFILGDKSLFTSEEQNIIQNNGISHLFALSGMHISLLYLFFNKVLNKLKFKKVIIYTFLFFYLIISGISISFLRAILLSLFIDLNKHYHIGLSNTQILFLIAFLMLLINPFALYSLSFIYTFVITFSLFFTHNFFPTKNKFLSILRISIITFLFSLPISIYINYEINLMAILNNIIMVPLVSIIIFPLALLSFLFSFLMPVFTFFIGVLENLNNIFNLLSITIIVGKISIVEVLIYYLILTLLVLTKGKVLLIIYLSYFLLLYNKNLFDNNYYVYYLDVSQGDSALLVSPKTKETILIDTGGEITYSKKEWQVRKKQTSTADSLITFFKSIRVRKIDLLVMSHGDADHIGYATKIVTNFKVCHTMINKGDTTSLEKNVTSLVTNISNYTSKYFNYEILGDKEYDNENDNSIVMYLNIYNTKFLFMGDASIKKEADLLQSYDLKNITFLKVGHHGSNTSTSASFIKKITPKYSIISVGKNNRYGHPKSEVLQTLSSSVIYRTDINGTIKIKINQKNFEITTSSP